MGENKKSFHNFAKNQLVLLFLHWSVNSLNIFKYIFRHFNVLCHFTMNFQIPFLRGCNNKHINNIDKKIILCYNNFVKLKNNYIYDVI